jgi:hypothetical protein
MTYRVVFAKRFRPDGTESDLDPTAALDVNIPDGVVVDKAFVERFEPEAKHSQEVLDEDDAFLGMASAEVWDYEVVNERSQDFVDAVRNSETVMELEELHSGVTEASDITSNPVGEGAATTRGTEGTGGIDDLTVVRADDPSLGLTNRGKKGPDDWAADTGETRVPDRGIATEGQTDRGSTLSPSKRR